MAEPTATIDPVLRSLEQLYTFRRSEEIFNFLRSNPFLAPLLMEAHDKITHYFGPSQKVVLTVVTDPEAIGLAKMFGYILTALEPEEAGKRLRLFDREWFLSQIFRAKGLLNFDVGFQ